MSEIIENEDRRTPPMVARILRDEPQQAGRRTLGRSGQGKETRSNRPFVRIVRCSRYLLDSNNLDDSCKATLDRIVEAGLIPDDGPEDIDLDVSQIQVGTEAEVGTSITISYPGNA